MDLYQVLALRGTVRVLQALAENGPMKYKELVGKVGFSTTTSRCLKALEIHEAIQKRVLNEAYRPVEYRITDKGRKLHQLAIEIEKLSEQ